MFARPAYGFGKPTRTEVLNTIQRWRGSDGFLREITVVRWTFANGVVRTCRVYQSYRQCKTGGKEFPAFEGRWAWTGERFTEPLNEPALNGIGGLL